jgi:CBS domain-containing protein
MESDDILLAEVGERKVADLMSRDPVFVTSDTTIAEVAELLQGFAIHGVPVIDWEDGLVGVISETDLVGVRAVAPPSASWHGLRARDLMTRPAVTITASQAVTEAAKLMTDGHVHRLVVLDDEGRPVGVISESDLVREMAEACGDH